jgi:parallel beta-helix repeat protein
MKKGCLFCGAIAATVFFTSCASVSVTPTDIPDDFVRIEGGTFTMSGGTISDNTAYDTSGGGVCVTVGSSLESGTFTMSGGTISGNKARFGGGVWVSFTFTMSGGTVSGNTASSSGGGVYIYNGTTFTMKGGTVYGSGAGTGLANTGTPGASLSLGGASAMAKYGNFDDIIESGLATDETLVGHD